jgi:hypothetical protein
MSHSRWPVVPTPLPVIASSFSRAASTLLGSRTMKLSLPPCTEMSPMSILGSRRISERTCSRIWSIRACATSLVCPSSSR